VATDALPFVSVVVPALDEEATIATCLDSLLRTDYPPDRREFIVVDNGSTDRTAEIIRRAPVRYLLETRRGTARARNRGIEASRGEILAFTDADCVATTGWLRGLVSGFAADGVGAVAGDVLPLPPRTAAQRYAARARHLSPYRYLRRPTFPFAVTANLAVRREVFSKIGLLDPDSPRGGECADFCTRLRRHTGMRIEVAPRAPVFHRYRESARALFRQHFGYGQGHAYLYEKYRAEIPWTWREALHVHGDLARTAGTAAAVGLRRVGRRASRSDVEFHSFELLRKLALRLGFTWYRMRPARRAGARP
jgi:glycosyltransferase involved in cell wall biosynthesis